MASLDGSDRGRCRLDFDKLGDADVDIFGEPSEQSIVTANPEVQQGGQWSPKDCQAWQRIAIIIPYRYKLKATIQQVSFFFTEHLNFTY